MWDGCNSKVISMFYLLNSLQIFLVKNLVAALLVYLFWDFGQLNKGIKSLNLTVR